MKRFQLNNTFHFLLKGCCYVLDETLYDSFFRDYGSLAFPGYWLKTKNCEVVIDCKYKYFSFKYIIKKLEKGISEWEKQYYETIIENLSLEYKIEEKAIIDVLKKEISFMKNRLIFRKWWFLK